MRQADCGHLRHTGHRQRGVCDRGGSTRRAGIVRAIQDRYRPDAGARRETGAVAVVARGPLGADFDVGVFMTFFLCICRDQRVGRKVQAGDGGEIDQDKQHLRGMPRSGSDCRACFRRSYLQNPWIEKTIRGGVEVAGGIGPFPNDMLACDASQRPPDSGRPHARRAASQRRATSLSVDCSLRRAARISSLISFNSATR
jgi:hypothetical protein